MTATHMLGAYVDEITWGRVAFCARHQTSGNVSEQVRQWVRQGLLRDFPEIQKQLRAESEVGVK